MAQALVKHFAGSYARCNHVALNKCRVNYRLKLLTRCYNSAVVSDFKADLNGGTVKYGVFVNSCSLLVAEQLSHSGYDWVLVDQQHSPASYETLGSMLAGIANGSALSFVRVAGPEDRAGIQQSLDMGARGIMIPSIVSRAETQRAVEYCLLPKAGVRSIFYPMRSAPPSTGLPAYLETANSNVYTCVQVETASCLEQLDEVLSVPNIDCAFVGPVDLCYSLGLHHKYSFNDMFSSPEMQGGCHAAITCAGTAVWFSSNIHIVAQLHDACIRDCMLQEGNTIVYEAVMMLGDSENVVQEAVKHVVTTCQAKGVVPGNFAFPSSVAASLVEAGFKVLAVATDLGLLADAAKQQMEQLPGR